MGRLFKSKTDSKPQHVRLKPSNSLLFLSLTDYLTVIIFFQVFKCSAKKITKKRVPVFFVRQMFQQKTHRKKKKRNLQKLSLSSNSTISPRWHHNCLDQRRHHRQPAPVSGGKIFRPDIFSPKQKSFQTEKLGVFAEKTCKQEFSTF